MSAPDFGALSERIKAQLKAWDVPSAVVSVVCDGETALSGGFGLRDGGTNAADAATLYQIASCSKAFTAAAAGVLASQGKLDFDKPVVSYMPSFRLNDSYATEHLTVRDFLSHRSGLPRHELAWYGTDFSRAQLMENLRDLPLNAPIRYRYQYSNFNYLITGCLIEAITGATFEDFLKTELLDKLGMTDSVVVAEDMFKTDNHALPFDHTEPYTMTGTKRIPFFSYPAAPLDGTGSPLAAAGCIISNATDMVKWLRFCLDRGKVGDAVLVREDLMDLICSPHIYVGVDDAYAPERSMSFYGLGWSIYSYRGYKMMEHGGNLNGFTSSTAFLPEKNIGVFVSVNMNVSLLADAIVHDVIDTVIGSAPTDWYQRMYDYNGVMFEGVKKLYASFGGEPVAGTNPSHPIADYAGVYEAPGYKRFQISVKNGELYGDFNTFFTRLTHHHYDTFATLDLLGELPAGVAVTFGSNPAGQIDTLSVVLGGEKDLQPIVFTKA